jgi:O-methyltransferase
MNITDQLLTKYPIISDQVDIKELGALLRELEKTLRRGATGNIVEFGCYVGTTSLFIRRLLDAYFHKPEKNRQLIRKNRHQKTQT